MVRILLLVLLGFFGCNNGHIRDEASGAPSEEPPPEIDTGKLERAIHAEINAVRQSHGLEQITWDDELAEIARHHSLDLARNDAFSHTGSNGSTPSDRAIEAGYECLKDVGDYRYTGIAENIFMTYVYGSYRTYHGPNGTRRTYEWKTQDEIARNVVSGWMDSPGHRRNILEARHDLEGIGIIRAGDRLFITQNLC